MHVLAINLLLDTYKQHCKINSAVKSVYIFLIEGDISDKDLLTICDQIRTSYQQHLGAHLLKSYVDTANATETCNIETVLKAMNVILRWKETTLKPTYESLYPPLITVGRRDLVDRLKKVLQQKGFSDRKFSVLTRLNLAELIMNFWNINCA